MDLYKNDVISKNIESYGKHINEFRSQVNIQGIWLFTSTLGCWGVDIPSIQLVASILLLFMFGFLVNNEVGDKRAFNKIKIEIENDINRCLVGDAKEDRLDELEKVEGLRKSIKHVFKTSPIFIVCYIFYFISVMTFLTRFSPQIKTLLFGII